MPRLAVPSLTPGRPPISVLADYDGTVSIVDVSDRLVQDAAGGDWAEDDRQYVAGLIGSRTYLQRQMASFHGDRDALIRAAAGLPHDETFAPFVRGARALGVPVEVVSDGLGFFIEPVLRLLGVPEVPVATAAVDFRDGRVSMTFPSGHPDCLVCGTCKRNRVLAHRAAGRAVVFVGDGETDRYAAAHADFVFAKGALAELCDRSSWPYARWDTFAEVGMWLAAEVDRWRAGRPTVRPSEHGFRCGPEVWGPGRTDPPPRRPLAGRTGD